MIEDNEKSAEYPMPGDVWEINGVPECVILSVNKTTLEYCDQKISYGPGIWEWDLVNFRTMPVGNLKRYMCKTVPLGEEPMDWLHNVSKTRLALGVVEEFNRKMNRHLHEKPVIEEIVVGGDFVLSVKQDGKEIGKLINGEVELEIPLAVLWELGEKAYELSNG